MRKYAKVKKQHGGVQVSGKRRTIDICARMLWRSPCKRLRLEGRGAPALSLHGGARSPRMACSTAAPPASNATSSCAALPAAAAIEGAELAAPRRSSPARRSRGLYPPAPMSEARAAEARGAADGGCAGPRSPRGVAVRSSVVLLLRVLSDLARRPRRHRLSLPARLRLGGLRLLDLAAANRAAARSVSASLIASATHCPKQHARGRCRQRRANARAQRANRHDGDGARGGHGKDMEGGADVGPRPATCR